MVEESIAKPRRPHTQTVRPHQWHITRGDPTTEKKFWKGVSPNMTKGVVAAPAFNASHQTPYCIYVEKTSKQCWIGRCNSQGA